MAKPTEVTLTVRHVEPAYPPDRAWQWKVTSPMGTFTGWRPTLAEAATLGAEDFAERVRETMTYITRNPERTA